MRLNSLLIGVLLIMSIGIVSAIQDDAGTYIPFTYSPVVNYSLINVNNSQYLGGYPASYFYPYSNPSNFYNSTTLPATNLSGYVPYSGAIDDVDLGSQNLITTGTGTFGSAYQAVLGDDANTRAVYATDGTNIVDVADGTSAISATGRVNINAVDDGSTTLRVKGNSGGFAFYPSINYLTGGAGGGEATAFFVGYDGSGFETNPLGVSFAMYPALGEIGLQGTVYGVSANPICINCQGGGVRFNTFDDGSGANNQFAGSASFNDGTNTVYLADGTEAGYFTDGGTIAQLSDGNSAVTGYKGIGSSAGLFYDDVNYVYLADGTEAGYFTDGTTEAIICDGTYAFYTNYDVLFAGGLLYTDIWGSALHVQADSFFDGSIQATGTGTFDSNGITLGSTSLSEAQLQALLDLI